MLKYSIAALALVAGSTCAFADPNGSAGPSSPGGAGGGGAAMERSGGSSMRGDSMEKGAGPSKEFGGSMKEDRGLRGVERGSARENSAADEGARDHSKRQANDDDRQLKNERQAGDRERQGQNRQAKDEDQNAKHKSSDRADRNDRNDRDNRMGAAEKSRNDRSSTGASEGTEGKGGPKGSITSVSPEQKTRVRAAFAGHRVAPARDIGVAVNVGVRIPRSVHIYAVPAAIISIVPDYRGYEYFMIDEDHVAIVDPDTLEVVDIIVVA